MSADRIIECVPNFSEGRDQAVIDAIARSLDSVEGATLLDVDPGAATNRTVMTLVGAPEAVLEAAFQGIRSAAELIDMSRHEGEHPRMGATDVCPLIPVRGVTMDDCAAWAGELAQRVGDELQIPVYLYEHAARTPERRNLAAVRAGEYEGLEGRIGDDSWKPDAGPFTFNKRSGATAIGARKFLLAYNVNVNSRNKKLATEIALEIREAGRNKRGPDGKFVRDENGVPIKRPGLLKHVKAVGWVIEEYGRAQVSANLTDYDVSNLHHVFDACEEHARKIGARVTGSELVGLVPLEAMLASGRHYLQRAGQSTGVPESRIVECAVQSLGLSEITPFDPREKIIEYRLEQTEGLLRRLRVDAFSDELSSESPAPGGGSVAALAGALSGALTAMVGNLTVGKKGMEEAFAAAETCACKAQELKDWFLRAIDADTEAFNDYMAALRMKKDTAQEQARRSAALAEARWTVTEVPLSVLRRVPELLEVAAAILEVGNPNAASDAATAAACARACAEGAWFNVLTNLKDIEDGPRKQETRAAADRVLEAARAGAQGVADAFAARM